MKNKKLTLECMLCEALEKHRFNNECPVDCLYRILSDRENLEQKLLQVIRLPEFKFYAAPPR